MSFKTTIFYLREYFFPLGCGGCGEALLKSEDTFYGLCEECRALFSSVLKNENRCEICGKPLITEKQTCLSCRDRAAAGNENYSENLLKLRTFFPYTGRFKAILGSYKFKRSLGVGNFLSGCLNQALDDFSPEIFNLTGNENAAWVPVPPRPGKIKKQGWDQIEFLAGRLEREYKRSRPESRYLPVCRCLKRLPSRSQKELNREERGTNLKGRILCTKPPPQTAILFDDIITTGATLNACASAILGGGAKKVYGVCLFFD